MCSKLIEYIQNYLDAFKNIARIQNVFVQADKSGISERHLLLLSAAMMS